MRINVAHALVEHFAHVPGDRRRAGRTPCGHHLAEALVDCARDGGFFAGSPACVGGAAAVVAVDLHVAGCPPTPTALLEGLLALLQRAARP